MSSLSKESSKNEIAPNPSINNQESLENNQVIDDKTAINPRENKEENGANQKETKAQDEDFININKINTNQEVQNNLGFINAEYYDEFNRPKYEEIVKYENSLREEMESKSPLVSELLDSSILKAEYSGSIYEKAINEFVLKINKWRTVRRDGNCFYRSFLFRLFEEYTQKRDPKLHKNLTKLVEESKDLCAENGYSWLVLEDFYNVLIFLIYLYFYFE